MGVIFIIIVSAELSNIDWDMGNCMCILDHKAIDPQNTNVTYKRKFSTMNLNQRLSISLILFGLRPD